MARTISIGGQNFEKLRKNNNFYVDKTHLIREWWESDDDVTLITLLCCPPGNGNSMHGCHGSVWSSRVVSSPKLGGIFKFLQAFLYFWTYDW